MSLHMKTSTTISHKVFSSPIENDHSVVIQVSNAVLQIKQLDEGDPEATPLFKSVCQDVADFFGRACWDDMSTRLSSSVLEVIEDLCNVDKGCCCVNNDQSSLWLQQMLV